MFSVRIGYLTFSKRAGRSILLKQIKILLILFVISALLLSITACNKHKDSTDNSGNPLASVEENIKPISPEELQRLMPPEFFTDPDGDGSIASNAYWLTAQSSPASLRLLPSIRAGVGSGKKILFYTRLNNQWLGFTSDLRQMLSDMGYTVDVYNFDTPLPDLSTVDVLAIHHCIGTPFSNPNDRPMPLSEKTKIQNFVASGKGFFYSGDWVKPDLPKFNDISGIFGVTMDLNYVDYIVTGRPPVTYYVPYWYAYVIDYINYYSTNPSQPILKKELVFNYSCFSNQTHEIFKDVNSLLVMGSSFVRPRVPALAAVRTHPTTSRPRDFPIVPEGYPIVLINEYGSGRYAMSCDTNAFGNDGFATSVLAGTDNRQFAKNIFNWLAKASVIEGDLTILNPHNNDAFDFGQSINFIGSQTGIITNIEWVSSIDGVFAADTLAVTKSNLSPGTHTITLRGIIGGPPASIRSIVGPSPQIRAAAVGDPVSATVMIMIKEPKPYPMILGIDFLSCSGLDNRNRIYDRKNEFKSAPVGQKFLEPTQWGGAINQSGGYVVESFNWPICYVRDGATSLTGPSKMKLNVKVDDFNGTINPGLIEVEASGTIFGANGFQQPCVFSSTSFNPAAWPATFFIESTTSLPNFVGDFRLEINWCFKLSGQTLANQRTPSESNFHRIFTLWEKPISSQDFGSIESDPTAYLEIVSLSCQLLASFDSSKSIDDVMTYLLNNYSTTGGFGYFRTRPPTSSDPRGLEAILNQTTVPKMGWCGELALLLKALNEANGIDVKVRNYRLKAAYFTTHRLVSAKMAADNVPPWPPTTAWSFQDHATVITKTSPIRAFDPTFKEKGPFTGYVNSLFDIYQLPNVFISDEPIPDYVGSEVSGPPSYVDYD